MRQLFKIGDTLRLFIKGAISILPGEGGCGNVVAAIVLRGEFDKFDRHAMLERDKGVPMSDLLDRFEELRAQSLSRLDELITDDDLEKPGYHPSLGNVTMRNLLATWAVHDLDHTSQIFAGMSAAYDQTVGPWKHYLGILLRREDPSAVPG